MKLAYRKCRNICLAVTAFIGACGGRTTLDPLVVADAGPCSSPDLHVPDQRIAAADVPSDRPDVGSDRPDVGSDRPDVAPESIVRPEVGRDLPHDLPSDLARDLGPDDGLELLSFIPSVGGTPVRVLLRDQQVYLGDWENGANPTPGTSTQDGTIQIYDVSEPRLPELRATLYTPGDQIHDLAMDGDWLFAANDALGLRMVDISKASSLRSVANRVGDSGDFATSVAVTVRGSGTNRQLYALAGYLYGGGLDIHPVPNGGPIPRPIHYTSTELPTRCDVYQIQVLGDRAYILTGDGERVAYVEILDISSLPATPTALGRIKLPFATYGGIGDIRLSGDLLYYSASDHTRSTQVGGLRIIDVRDPKQPALVGSLDLVAGSIDWKGTGLAVAGQEVYFIASSGVKVIDVSTPTRPTQRFSAPFPAAFGTCQGGTAVVKGDLLYVGAYCSPSSVPSVTRGGLAIYRRH